MREVKAYRWSIITQTKENKKLVQELEELCKKHNAMILGVEPVVIDMDKVTKRLEDG